ncbi:MAG: hypothetical protein AB7E05_02815 [Sphingobium sp.]
MNPFEMVVLIVAIVVAGRVLAVRYGRHGAGGGGGDAPSAARTAEMEQMRAEIGKLKDRVAVLERLATDDSAALEREIEKLRGQP